MSNILHATVLETHHWTDKLFTLKLTRDPGFRFESGQFAMIGLQVEGKPIMRAYSVVSAHYDDFLEFLSIKVPDGPLTSRLQHVQPGDQILINRKTTGTLVLGNLLPGKRVYLLSTGTGIAPFLSLIKDPDIYDRFEQVVLVHGCRQVNELVYRQLIEHELPNHELLGDEAAAKLTYYPTITREPFANQGRITDLVRSGKLFADLGLPAFDKDADRVMICGNPAMTKELADYCEELGFAEGSSGRPGHYVIEKAFVEK